MKQENKFVIKHSIVILLATIFWLIPPKIVLSLDNSIQNKSESKPDYLETGRKITAILNKFMDMGYDKRVRPNYGGPPVDVNVTMRILSISSVSEVLMDFTADFYFRQTWHDPRLAFTKLNDIKTLYVGAEVSKKIWLPDTFFGNEKTAYFHEATTPNVFLRIDHSGEVYRSIRLTVTSSCPMNLQYFPMDRQRCTIEAESYGYNVRDIKYHWARSTAVERDEDISLPQFDIVHTVQKYRVEELSSGNYSRLIAELHFVRRMGYYLIQIYIPSSLIVVISWVSFWLHRNASPARVQLGVTTVLTMTTLMSSTNSALPKISYIKSIDIFLGTCFIMVFAALLEYATVGYLGKRIAMRKAQLQHAQSQAQAKTFAQLQAQGAQGDPIPLFTSSSNNGAMSQESPIDLVQNFHTESQLQIFPNKIPPEVPTRYQCSTAHDRFIQSHRHSVRATRKELPCQLEPEHLSSMVLQGQEGSLFEAEPVKGSANQQICYQRSGQQLEHACHGNHNETCQRQAHSQSQSRFDGYQFPLPPCGKQNIIRDNIQAQGDGSCDCSMNNNYHPGNCFDLNTNYCSTQSRQITCNCQCLCQRQQQQQYRRGKLHTTNEPRQHQEHSPNPIGSGKIPSSGASLAATAAAATLVNIHRKNKGLPPSTNPNFVPFNWMMNSSSGKGIETIFGIRPSDIDKYSRVVFPVCFVCFQLMYWIIYLHISALPEPEHQGS